MEKKTAKKTKQNSSGKAHKKDFLVVGLDASAGGVKALQEFFAAMPADSGMAFVAILHLSPEHESSLAQILQMRTSMPVREVTETVKVEPNHVYVIPPNWQVEMVDGVIRPANSLSPLEHPIAIDVQLTVKQHETTVEELKASNEELQAINEELRSASEELEMSKKELQSVNEEITTVNQELKEKIDETTRVNSDLSNLMAATDIATIFLDKNLKIKRYTPPVEDFFNITKADIGRPLDHFTHKLNYDDLAKDAEKVLRKLAPVEHEITDKNNRAFLTRFVPYRTLDDRIDGIVLNFIDITANRESSERLRRSEEKYRTLFDSIDEGFCIIELLFNKRGKPFDYRILEANPAFYAQTGFTENVVGKTMLELAPDHEKFWYEAYGRIALTGVPARFEHQATAFDRWYDVYAFRVGDPEERKVAVIFNDIGERRRAEQAVRESEERLRIATETALMYSWEYDEAVGTYKFSENAAEILGVAPERLPQTAEDTYSIVHPDDLQIVRRELRKALKTGKGFSAEVRSMKDSGEVVCLSVETTVIKDGNRKPARIIGIAQDVTARRQAEQALIDSEKRLRIAIDAAEMATWDWNLETDEIIWNERHFSLLGRKPNGKPQRPEDFFRQVHPDDQKWVGERLNRAIKTGTNFEAEFRVVRRDGKIRWMEGYGHVMEYRAGKPVRMSGVMSDITGRKNAEVSLRQSEERLRLIMKSITDYAIITTDEHCVINGWNTGAEKTFGYTAEEAIGQTCDMIFTPEDRKAGVPKKEIETAMRKGCAEDNRWHIRKDGSRFFASGVMTPIRDGELEGFVKITTDQTARMEAERALQEKETLRRLVSGQEEERRRIARDIHDHFGQQMTALRMKIEAVKKVCDRQPMPDKNAARDIADAQKIAAGLDSDIDFIAWELRPAALDDLGLRVTLQNFVRDWSHHTKIAADFHTAGLGKKNLAFETETNLYRIAQESLNNVYKHAKASRVDVILELRKDEIVLIVEDDGIGFNVNAKPAKDKGMGLGGMRERAALLGGTLDLESDKGKGTTVFARVPAKFSE
jgi:PAS domain S-box-containing protein